MITSALTLCLLAGCSRPVPPKVAQDSDPVAKKEKVEIVLPPDAHAEHRGRKAGDYVVYRFSGSYRSEPVELVQRVVARQGDILVVDHVIDDRVTFRLEIDDRPASRGRILEVSRVVDGETQPVRADSYETLMASLVLIADENQGLIDDETVRLELGDTAVEAQKLTYRVRLGERVGFMSTLSAEGFAWGDAGGEIRSADGELLYKAEVVEMGHAEAAPIAVGEPYDTLEGLDILDE